MLARAARLPHPGAWPPGAGFMAWLGLAALLLAALAGCAFVNPTSIAPGTPGADIVRQLGSPTARYPLAGGGERWQYTRQPAGQTVYNIDLDAAGRALRAEQVMNEALFAARIRPNVWTRADVLREYGPPARTMGVHNFDGTIWIWRYADGPTWRLLYIDLDRGGTVRGWSNGDEPLPDPPDMR